MSSHINVQESSSADLPENSLLPEYLPVLQDLTSNMFHKLYGATMLRLLATSALLASTVARLDWTDWTSTTTSTDTPTTSPTQCITDTQASQFVTWYADLHAHPGSTQFNTTAHLLFTDDQHQYSDTYASLTGKIPDGTPAYSNVQAFIDAQFSMSAFPNITSNYAFTCDKIFWRWTSNGFGHGKERVSGITEMDVVWVTSSASDKEHYGDVRLVPKVSAAYGEFNAAALVVDLGGSYAVPSHS
jgi:hypothetical protein